MANEYHSSYINETEQIAEIKENDLPEEILLSTSFDSCIAISPDSKQIVIFRPEKQDFTLYSIDDLSLSRTISPKQIYEKNIYPLKSKRLHWSESDVKGKLLRWSIAISNCVHNDKNERLIAFSCFDARRFLHRDDKNNLDSGDKVNNQHVDNESDLESGRKYVPQTRVISATDGSEIYTSPIVGVVRFLNSDDNSEDSDKSLKNETVIIIVNASGIFKEAINNKKKKQGFFSQLSKIKQFELPQQLSNRLSRDWKDSLELLHTSIIKNYFMVHTLENRQQIIEMYSLITGDLKMLFKRHEYSAVPNIILGSPIFSISQNEKILAFCRETTNITLYSIENGLEISTKRLEGQKGIYKIADINFIDNDSKLLIVLEEKEDRYRGEISKNHQVFVVWDLFTTFKNSVRQIDYSETENPLKMDVAYRLMNSHGNVFALRDRGDIFSMLDHKDVASIRKPTSGKAMINFDSKKFKKISPDDITTSNHAIYTIDGKRSDTSELAIINNVEPWQKKKNYFRISIYLDRDKNSQLIISHNTIQVWKYRNNNNAMEERDECDRVLEYIWARKKEIDVQELQIGEREFVLKVSMPSTIPSTPPKSVTIHWPNNVNVLEGACRALYVLSEKKDSVISFVNVSRIEYLVEQTQRLVRKYIPKYGIFRLTSIRYPIMKYLIKSSQENGDGGSTTEISKSDLHHAILCIKERKDSTLILKYLIDYYADNTKEYNNHGWMFTVSEAIPLLYDNNLGEFVQYLFKKSCFGITEAYTSPLHINPYDQKKGNNADVIHSLDIIKIYIVPLPDFTVYPNSQGPKDNFENYSKYFWFLLTFLWPRKKVINNTEDMSPFLRVIHEENGYEIYRTPTIMAVLDFKWSAAQSNTILKINLVVYIYTGWYLIVTEIMQLIREGLGRYMNIYNLFDLGSVLLPLADSIVGISFDQQMHTSAFNSVLAFTILVLWLELDDLGLQIPTYKIKDTSNSDLYSNITIYQDIDKSSRLDNYFSNPFSSIEAVFNGRWDQLDQWGSYTINAMSVLGSIILVLIFQNMLIAFMNGAFDKANEAGLTAVHRYRAEPVAEYEALEKYFGSRRDNPRYIYYIPEPDMIETWLEETEKEEKQELRHMDNSLYSKKYQHTQDEGSSNSMEIISNIDKISFMDEETFLSKFASKSNMKSQRNWKSSNTLLKKTSYNKSSNESLSKDPGSTNVDNQLSMQEKLNNLENEFKKFSTKFDELDQNLKTILKTLNNINNPK
ncbi:7086_t:CDS:10 [Diversispora eburnea]|uniref:7086_t:CDS:1 n=2 Tax=Diversisporales TaxID=214509 RepID=A0A9N9F6Z5_9GLOM|nr:7086_t:CDS:10 [Diversispora eburnea]